MIRRKPLQRTPWRRRRPDDPRARGRESASSQEWQIICAEVRRRAGWWREACGRRSRVDVHHVVKRSQGGSDFDLDRLVALCPACHGQTDAPLATGRLIVTPLGMVDSRSTWCTGRRSTDGRRVAAIYCLTGSVAAPLPLVADERSSSR
jgi:HNH endonuclease